METPLTLCSPGIRVFEDADTATKQRHDGIGSLAHLRHHGVPVVGAASRMGCHSNLGNLPDLFGHTIASPGCRGRAHVGVGLFVDNQTGLGDITCVDSVDRSKECRQIIGVAGGAPRSRRVSSRLDGKEPFRLPWSTSLGQDDHASLPVSSSVTASPAPLNAIKSCSLTAKLA